MTIQQHLLAVVLAVMMFGAIAYALWVLRCELSAEIAKDSSDDDGDADD